MLIISKNLPFHNVKKPNKMKMAKKIWKTWVQVSALQQMIKHEKFDEKTYNIQPRTHEKYSFKSIQVFNTNVVNSMHTQHNYSMYLETCICIQMI